jgi:hypothetical protein
MYPLALLSNFKPLEYNTYSKTKEIKLKENCPHLTSAFPTAKLSRIPPVTIRAQLKYYFPGSLMDFLPLLKD